MNKHYQDQLPFYAAGQLDTSERAELEKHLAQCAVCRDELRFWRDMAAGITTSATAISAPTDLAERALRRIHTPTPFVRVFQVTFSLLRVQAYLIKGEMWASSAAVMALGVMVALLADRTGVITFIAPLIAAASLAAIYGSENDPAAELALSTPTPLWKILLARLTLVSGYNLALTLAASFALLLIVPVDLLGSVILAWLGPLTFLSALALLLSMWIGGSNAVTLAYGLWIVQYIQLPPALAAWAASPALENALAGYRHFWQSPALLLTLALLVLCLALFSTRREDQLVSTRTA